MSRSSESMEQAKSNIGSGKRGIGDFPARVWRGGIHQAIGGQAAGVSGSGQEEAYP